MGVVILQILQWILRIILFLLLFLLVILAVVLIVPVRYQANGELLEKKPGVKGKITWFFYLIYVSFVYEDRLRIQARVFGIKVFDTEKKMEQSEFKQVQNQELIVEDEQIEENIDADMDSMSQDRNCQENDCQTDVQDEIEQIFAEDKDEVPSMQTTFPDYSMETDEPVIHKKKEKKSFAQKIKEWKEKVQELIQKIRDIIDKIKAGKLKVEHYLELWNRKETQITFSRAKTKLGRMIKAVLPRKWEIVGEIGLDNPCTTGQLMGILGALYPVIGGRIKMVPDFEHEVMKIQGRLKGHIRLGNLLYQVVSLLLNRQCFKFIKLILDELSSSKKSVKEI